MRGCRLGAALLLLAALTGTAGAQSPTVAEPPAGDMRELVDAARATAKATREAVDYARVTPDLLTQILAKLDKLEDKLDRIDGAVRAQGAKRR